MKNSAFLILSMGLFGCVTASTPPPEPQIPLTAYEIQGRQAMALGLDAQIDALNGQIWHAQAMAEHSRMRAAQFQMLSGPSGDAMMSNAEAEAASHDAQVQSLLSMKAHLESQRAIYR